MSGFGDHEPEDAWHPADRLDVLAFNLARRIAALDGDPVPVQIGDATGDLLDVVAFRLAPLRTRTDLDARTALRVYLLIADLDHVRARLEVET